MATYYDEEERKKGGFWGKFLAVLLGFLFGIIATIGSIAAIGYALFAKIKIKDGISSVNKITGSDIDYKEYITDEYAEKTISALLSDLSSLVSEFQGGKGSLSSLNKISPQVETQVTKIADTLQSDYNIPLAVNSPHKDAEGNILDDADNVIIDKDGNVVKQDGNGNAILTGDDGEMLVGLMDVPLSQLAPFIKKSMEPIELGAVLASQKIDMLKQGANNYELMMLLCYGDKTDYETDGNGNIVRDENGKAVMKNGAKATTVGDFLSGEGGEGESGGVVSILEKISVAGLLDATNSLDESNELVRALLYETDTYALDDENAFTAPDGTKYTYDAEAGQWTDGKGGRIRPVSAPLKAAAFSYAASDSSSLYVYRVYDKDGKLVCSLAAAEESGKFEAYDENDELKTSPRSVKSFMNALGGEGGDITDLLSDVQLSALLGLDEKTYSEDTKMLYALAYGTLGSDFKLETNADGKEEVVMLGGSKPATVSDLLDGGNALFDKISLDSIMTVKRTDNVICALAYGTKGKTYTWEEGDEAPAMLPVRYTLKADGLYDDNDEKAHAVLDEETGVYTVTIAETEGETKSTIYYAKAEKTGDATYYLYQTPDCSGEKLLYQKTTLGDLLSGPNDLLNDIQLGSLMGLTATSDKILLALAYGTKGTDYEIVTTTDAETGKEIKTLVLLEGGKKPTTVGDLTDDESAGKLLNDIQLGSVLGISPLDKYDEDAENDPDPLMLALAYGEEGIDYEVAREDGENVIRWLGDSKPRTIRDLTAGNSSLFNSITLASVMDIKPDSPPLMIALAYGKESHYIMENGNFVMLPVQYTKQGDTLLDDDGEAVNAVLNPDTNIWTVTEENGKDITVRYAKADDDGYYYLYADESCAGSKIAYKKTSISDLKGSSASDVIYNIQLGTVLDISPLDKYDAEKEEPDALMLSLAYGEENTHYRIKTDAEGAYYIEWLTDAATGKKYAPRTIRDLQSGNIIDEVQLSSVLEVSPLDPDADKLMAALAFGNEGQHYEIVDGEIVWLTDAEGNPYAPRTIADLKKGSAIVNDIYLATVLDVTPASNGVLISLAYGNEGENFVYERDADGNKTGFRMINDSMPRTIAQLKDGTLIDDVQLGAVLGVSPLDNYDENPENDPDSLMLALAYGNEGQHYKVLNGEVVWLTDAEGNSYAPRTIKDLKKGSAVIDDIYLSTVLDVGPSSGDIMLALAYGNEGEDYEIVNGEIHMLRDATPRTISELKKGDLIDNIRLSAVLTAAKKDDKISMYLLYGIEGTHYRYDEPTDKIEMLGREVGVLNNVAYDERGNALPGAVEAAGAGESFIYTYTYNDTIWLLTSLSGKTTETENGTIEYYCVTDETGAAVLYRPRTIGDLSGNSTLVSDITKDLTIQDLVGDTGDSKLLNAISAWKIDELSNQKKIMSLKMSDVIEIDDSSPAILKAMQGWTLGDLNDQDKINTLKLTDILEKTQVENNTILKHLQNSTVASLADDLENLKLQKVFADDVYKTGKTEEGTIYFVNQKGERLYENPADGKFYTSDTFEPATESARVLTGTWKYLLTDKEGKEGDYTITDMGTLVSNMTANIQKATLKDLKEDGIISLSDATFLTKEIKYDFTYTYLGTNISLGSVPTKYYKDADKKELKKFVGELTITELLNYVGEVINLFSK